MCHPYRCVFRGFFGLRGLATGTECGAGVTAVVGLGVDVAVGVWDSIGLEVTVNKGQNSVL